MTSETDINLPETVLTRMADRGGGPAISFQDVSKHFPATDGSRLEVLRDVSFDVRIGGVVAILGPSGSGKSTLLNMAAGLIFPDAGRVVVMGQRTDAAVDWSHVGYMFQDDRLLPWRVAVRNVALALEAGAMPAAERLRRARAVLDLVGLGGFEQSYPYQLSGGMRSRVALARSLVGERSSMHRELLRIHAMRAMTILFVTHDVEEAVVLADHVVMMSARPGRVRRTIDISLPQPRIGTENAIALANELRASLEAEPTQEIPA